MSALAEGQILVGYLLRLSITNSSLLWNLVLLKWIVITFEIELLLFLLNDLPVLLHLEIFKLSLSMELKCVLRNHDTNVQAHVTIRSVHHAPSDQVSHLEISHILSELVQVVGYEENKSFVY